MNKQLTDSSAVAVAAAFADGESHLGVAKRQIGMKLIHCFSEDKSATLENQPSSGKLGNPAQVKSLTAMARTNNVKQKKFHSEEAVSLGLAQYIINLSHKFIKAKDCFTVVLSGGSLIHTMRKLVEEPNIGCVDWSKWFVFWLDERVVSLEDPDGNFKLAYDERVVLRFSFSGEEKF